MIPYVTCERCGRSVRSKHFMEHAEKYCPRRDSPPPPDVRERHANQQRRDIAEAIRNR